MKLCDEEKMLMLVAITDTFLVHQSSSVITLRSMTYKLGSISGEGFLLACVLNDSNRVNI